MNGLEFPQDRVQDLASWKITAMSHRVQALFVRAEGAVVPVPGCLSYFSLAMTKLHDQGVL